MVKPKINFIQSSNKLECSCIVDGKEIKTGNTGSITLEEAVATQISRRKLPKNVMITIPYNKGRLSYDRIISRSKGDNYSIQIYGLEILNEKLSASEYYDKFLKADAIKEYLKATAPRDGVMTPIGICFYFKAENVKDVLAECERIIDELIIELNSPSQN